MTATQPHPPATQAIAPAKSEWRLCLWLVVILGGAYALLQNGYWAAGPDTSFYISVARSLALGRGFVFNGGAVARIPPGWPMLLAGAMRISGAFGFLNLVPMVCLLGASVMWYWILRRIAPPRRAFQAVLLSGFVYSWYTSSIQLRSEAFFCLVLCGAILTALAISEGKAQAWRITLLILLSILAVNIRYAGIAGLAIIAGALLSGQRRLAFSRQLVALMLTIGLTAGSFAYTRYILEHVLPPKSAGGEVRAHDDYDQREEKPAMVAIVGHGGPLVYIVQALFAGQWTADVLWMPFHIGVTSVPIALAVNAFGWFLLVVYFAYAWRLARSFQFLLLGAALYSGAIIARWSVVNPRYLVPVAPLILLGVWMGFEHLGQTLRRPAAARLFRFGAGMFVATLVLCNGLLFVIDVAVARSPRLYEWYNAGEVSQLLETARAINALNPKDGEVAVNGQIINLNRARPNGFAMRGLVMLTDRGINVIFNKVDPHKLGPKGPRKKTPKASATKNPASASMNHGAARLIADEIGEGNPRSPALVKYASAHGIVYYAYKPPGSLWHAWHFKMTWLQRKLTKKAPPARAAWELYQLKNGKFEPLPIPPLNESWPRRVPGL